MLPVAFNPDLPVFAALSFETSAGRFEAGAPFPWRNVCDELALRTMWRAGLVRNGHAQAAPEPAPDGDPATQPELELVEPRRAAGRRRGQG